MAVHLPSNLAAGPPQVIRLRAGTPAAPRRDSVPLLPPGPGGVWRLLPRRTHRSTPS